jgi:hypothetical protein
VFLRTGSFSLPVFILADRINHRFITLIDVFLSLEESNK